MTPYKFKNLSIIVPDVELTAKSESEAKPGAAGIGRARLCNTKGGTWLVRRRFVVTIIRMMMSKGKIVLLDAL
jgi:hypothetical protein